ncbi:MAG: ylyB [Bacillales bacterium]|jgi:23S rRNA pseudouridine1911/1915/1917 synthase|nr:ylyB [Bacillales bacterium]
MEKIELVIEIEDVGQRLDKVLSDRLTDYSRSQIQTWIKDNDLLVNNETIKGNYKCKKGDKISIIVPEVEELEILPENISLDIAFEDDDVIVVNKPKGMVVHPAPGHYTGTLVNALLYHCKDSLSGINGVARPGIVHRIDMDTSGLLMVAKNDFAHEKLVDQLQKKTVTRKYLAIVHGEIPHERGTIDAPIGRDTADRQRMTVTEDNSREAVTHFEVIEKFKDFTYVECILETGRTHQIRVHMKYIGFPLAGDPKYGPRKTLDINGQALHAAVLGFNHPRTNEYIEFSRPIPEEMNRLLQFLKNSD